MNHTGPTILKEAMQEMQRCSPHKHKLAEATLVCAWKAAMPRVVLTRTDRLFYKQEKLFVQISSGPLRQELLLNKDKVLELLKTHTQGFSLTDVVFF